MCAPVPVHNVQAVAVWGNKMARSLGCGPIPWRLRRGGAATLAVLIQGCFLDFSGNWEPDEERCGVQVKWNGQRDRDNFCPEIERCRDALGYGLDDGATVEFVGDLLPYCLRERVAGCYTPDFDHIYLAVADAIGDTALCHELLHRAFFHQRDGDPDYGHRSPLWHQLP